MEKDPLLSSHHCWWNSFPCGLLDWGFPSGSDGKVSACNVGDLDSIPGLGRSPGEGNGNPIQYPCLENPMDRGALWATVHGITESDTTEWFHFHFLLSLYWTEGLRFFGWLLAGVPCHVGLCNVVLVFIKSSKGESLSPRQMLQCHVI